MKITILESGRGLGKSTIARRLRDGLTNTVLVNFTGNNEDSEAGMDRTFHHYNNWLTFFQYEKFDETPFNFLCDRSFFSEQVYSSLYKQYDFTDKFQVLLRKLNELGAKEDVRVIHLVSSKENIERNLLREGKAHLFGNVAFADDVHKTLRQQAAYEMMFNGLRLQGNYSNIKFLTADVTNLSIDEATNSVKSLI